MNEHNHVTPRNLVKQRVQITRRQFLGLMGIVGAGMGSICGGLTAGLFIAGHPEPTPTDPPTLIPPSPTAIVEKPAMVEREAWGALSPNINAVNEHGYYDKETNPEGWYVYPDALKDSYQTVVIHHSGFYDGDGQATLAEIQRSHREDRGWADVGYHFIIDKDGTIYEGRELNVRGAHVEGFNTGSTGICLMGDFRFEAPSQAQLNATYALNQWLIFRVRPTHLAGHSQFNDWTECPGTFLANQLQSIADHGGLILGTDGYAPALHVSGDCGCCACRSTI